MTYKKILLIALSGAGDVLMATPLIHELRRNYPKAQIDVLVQQGQVTQDILKNNHDLNNVIWFHFMKEGTPKSLLFCHKLRKKRYDLSITLYPQARYHYTGVSFLIGAKKRIGFHYQSQPLKLNALFYHQTIQEDLSKHVVENNLKVLEALGLGQKKKSKLHLHLKKINENFATKFLKKNEIKKPVVIHAGSGTMKNFASKRWPLQRFAELARELAFKQKAQIILAGGPDEAILKQTLVHQSGLIPGKQIFDLDTNINNTAAVIKKAKLVISNDSVIAHLTAAIGTHIIALFGPTDQHHTGPFTEKATLLSKRPAHIKPYQHGAKKITHAQAQTMKLLSVENVLDEAKKILN
jgi:lipopolysaccharide heptosyltransferase II